MLSSLFVATALIASAWAADPPLPPAVLVWMQATPPDAEIQEKAAKIVGGTVAQRAWSDITLDPQAATEVDAERIAALSRVIDESQAKWEVFDAETSIARGIAAHCDPIALLRDDADRAALLKALVWQGASITRPYPDSIFNSLEETAPFRVAVANQVMVRPWLDAIALDPKHNFERSEFPDGQSLARVKTLQEQIALLPRATLTVDPLPAGIEAVVDGRTVAAGAVELPAGHHYAHLVRNGIVANRMEFDLTPSGKANLAIRVSAEELAAARAKVLISATDVPNDVLLGIKALAARSSPPPRVFIAAMDDKGRPVVLPLAGGAVVEKIRAVTVMFTGELGGGVIESQGFAGKKGAEFVAPGFGGDLGFEVGIYNAVIQIGGELYLTPTAQMAFGSEGGTTPEDNDHASAMFHPHGGVGVYLPRPQPKKAYFLVTGNYGWLSPGALGVGAQLGTGIAMGDGTTWLRISVAGFRGTQMEGFAAAGTPTSALMLRIGFASLL